MRKAVLSLAVLALAASAGAQTPLKEPDLSVPTKIAPAYFGPNAFPVPDMTGGTEAGMWTMEFWAGSASGKGYGMEGDRTDDLFLRLTVPLGDRVSLELWGVVLEHYRMGEEVCRMRRVDADTPASGIVAGDLYVSTCIALLTQKKNGVGLTVRTALKTASGGSFPMARYYDCPGYFFDGTLSRMFILSPRSRFVLAASAGFLCWQTDNGRQNDAFMYGAKALFAYGRLSLSAEYGGYVGWERDGDAPMVLKTAAGLDAGRMGVRLEYRTGFVDWPFSQLRLGLVYEFEKKKKHEDQDRKLRP